MLEKPPNMKNDSVIHVRTKAWPLKSFVGFVKAGKIYHFKSVSIFFSGKDMTTPLSTITLSEKNYLEGPFSGI